MPHIDDVYTILTRVPGEHGDFFAGFDEFGEGLGYSPREMATLRLKKEVCEKLESTLQGKGALDLEDAYAAVLEAHPRWKSTVVESQDYEVWELELLDTPYTHEIESLLFGLLEDMELSLADEDEAPDCKENGSKEPIESLRLTGEDCRKYEESLLSTSMLVDALSALFGPVR